MPNTKGAAKKATVKKRVVKKAVKKVKTKADEEKIIPPVDPVETAPIAPVETAPEIKSEPKKEKYPGLVLRNVLGEDMDPKDYFFIEGTLTDPVVPGFFNKVCGLPVDREELIAIFNEVFNPKDGFLFYRARNKEVYVIIVPLKYAQIGKQYDSRDGDHQKHSISFIKEGSANEETLRIKLKRVANNLKYEKK